MAAVHFVSGLPRSGSTLLAALLRQNPRFHAGMSGPLAGLFGALLSEMSARNEFSVFIDDAKRERILHGLLDSIERLIQRNVFTPSSIFNFNPGLRVV